MNHATQTTTSPADNAPCEGFWRSLCHRLAMALECLPNTMPESNLHVVRKAEALSAQSAQPTVEWQFCDTPKNKEHAPVWRGCTAEQARSYTLSSDHQVRELIVRSSVRSKDALVQPFTADLWSELCDLRSRHLVDVDARVVALQSEIDRLQGLLEPQGSETPAANAAQIGQGEDTRRTERQTNHETGPAPALVAV